ncbi:hypothetical protein ACMAZF_04285 [Psychrobium sp. nBUS_13]|uniref:hypothetical protein n=1 Tax=Psychrobium sp. nBUS_13 TaxID=3395319 RepID=UPI003EBA1FFD
MPEQDCRREGVRVAVRNADHIEAIVYTEQGVPEFCDEYEINLGGIKVNSNFSELKNNRVRVSLFNSKDQRVEIQSTIMSSSLRNSVIKFDPLNQEQYTVLCNMLTLQQPIDE